MKTTGITGLILAGGNSRRMGRDKAMLPWGKTTLLEHTIERLKPFCREIVISSNHPEHGQYHFPVIPDEEAGKGPIAGIYSVMKQTKGSAYLVLSVDMPFVKEEVLLDLLSFQEGYRFVVPVHPNGRIEPTCALYQRTLLPELEMMIKQGEYRLYPLASLPGCKQIRVEENPSVYSAEVFTNLNSLKEYTQYFK